MGEVGNLDGCPDPDGDIPQSALDQSDSLTEAYNELRRQKDQLSSAEYRQRLNSLCTEILDREG